MKKPFASGLSGVYPSAFSAFFISKSKKNTICWRSALCAMVLFCIGGFAKAQVVTIATNSSEYTGANSFNQNPSAISFVIENTNNYAIKLKEIANFCTAAENNSTWTIFYSATSLSGLAMSLNSSEWTALATSGTIPVTSTGITTLFTNINFTIPNNTQYRFVLQNNGPGYIRFSGYPVDIFYTPPSVNSFSGSGIILKVGNAQVAGQSVGYAGSESLSITPAYFTGSVVCQGAAGCTTPPVAGNITASSQVVYSGSPVTFSVPAGGAGLYYQWQSSADNITYSNITGATLPSYTGAQTASQWIRVAVTCSGVTGYSSALFVTVNPLHPGGTFTINSAQNTGGTNFQSFNAAINAIKLGIASPVVFNVVPGSGPYNEQLIIDSIPGTSATNTITFNGNGRVIQYSSSNANELAVIKIQRADYIIIDSLVIDSRGAGKYQFGVQLMNRADNNTIRKCSIMVQAGTDTSTYYAGIVVNNSASNATSGAALCNNNTIENNTIDGGYYGIVLTGGSVSSGGFGGYYYISLVRNTRIINNAIRNFYSYGILGSYTSNTIIEGNSISRPSRTMVGTFYGMYFRESTLSSRINGNRIFNPFGGNPSSTKSATGIQILSSFPREGEDNIISNNLIYNLNGNGAITVFNNYRSSLNRYYHNTISLDDKSSTSTEVACVLDYGNTTLTFQNNIVSISRGGTGKKYAIIESIPLPSTLVMNNNNYYLDPTTPNAFIGHVFQLHQDFATLSAWQTSLNRDVNSLSVNPVYTNLGGENFKPTSYFLDNKGANGGITTDFNNLLRSASTPDIGAYEFTGEGCVSPPTAGTAVLVTSPAVCSTILFPTGEESDSKISLSLTGNSTGTGQTYQWQSSYSVTGPFISVGNVMTLADTSFLYSSADNGKYYRAAVTCGAAVVYSTTVKITSKALAGGTYTINGVLPESQTNFKTLTSAVKALKCGIDGPVVFNIATGSYNEQIKLDAIPGASQTNRVVFQSASGNRSDVSLYFNTVGSAFSLVRLNGASYITFRNISLLHFMPPVPLQMQYASGFEINGGAYDSIINCNIQLPAILDNAADTYVTGILATNARNMGFLNNAISRGNYGVHITEGKEITITGNTVSTSVSAINITDVGNLKVNSNTLTAAGSQNSTVVNIVNCDSALRVMNNTVTGSINASAYAATAINILNCNNTALSPGKLMNNLVNMAGSSSNTLATSSGVILGSSTDFIMANNVVTMLTSNCIHAGLTCSGANLQVYNNSINTNPKDGVDYANGNVTTAGFTGINIGIKNNIIVNKSRGVAMFIANPANVVSDYNDLYSSGNTLVKSGTPLVMYSSLKAWQTDSRRDSNSISYRPVFIDSIKLQPDRTKPEVWALNGGGTHIAGNDKDLLGNARPTMLSQGVPDLGAYEFTPLTLPPMATAVPAQAVPGTTQSFVFAGDTIAKITWAEGSDVPSSVEAMRFTGVQAPFYTGNNFMYFYDSIHATGSGNYNYTIELFYKDSWRGTILNESAIKLARQSSGSPWNTYISSTCDPEINKITSGPLTGFSIFTGVENAFALPLKFFELSASVTGMNIMLNWNVTASSSTGKFEIERSVDGISYALLQTVNAQYAGNATYSVVDASAVLNHSILYYRIKVISNNGTYEYSKVVVVHLGKLINVVRVLPNPFLNELSVNITLAANALVNVTLTDDKGVVLAKQVHRAGRGNTQLQITGLEKLSRGIYFLNIQANGERQTFKVVK